MSGKNAVVYSPADKNLFNLCGKTKKAAIVQIVFLSYIACVLWNLLNFRKEIRILTLCLDPCYSGKSIGFQLFPAELSIVKAVKFEASVMSVWASLYLGYIVLLGEHCPTSRTKYRHSSERDCMHLEPFQDLTGFWDCDWMQPSFMRDQSSQGENFSVASTAAASTACICCS